MSRAERDTIAAIATPAGTGGVGIVRVSGPSAGAVLAAVLGRAVTEFPDRRLVQGVARDRDGERLDQVLAVLMLGPRSFTGEDVAEIHGHGGATNMTRLLRATIAAGARHAEPGEFTRRAFEHGRIDLIRAEAILGVVEAASERAWRLAQAQLAGALGVHVSEFRAHATTLLAEVEACIDFPEEGEHYLGQAHVGERARALGRSLADLAATYHLGKAVRDGIDVALVGPVNSGKSSVFNHLVGAERALVDAAPGTTRDFVEARVVWDGIAVTLVDTAGNREAEHSVERRGIELGQRRAEQADLRVCAHSAEHGVSVTQAEEPGTLHIVTKGDLLPAGESGALLVTSAHTGQGLDELRRLVLDRVCGRAADADEGHVVTSERQRDLLVQAAEAFERAASATEAPIEVLALELREGAERLAEIMGERVGEEVLDDLFARFCIGK